MKIDVNIKSQQGKDVVYNLIVAHLNFKKNKVNIIFDFGEYAVECHYNKSRMENEVDCMWDDIVDSIKEKGYDLGELIESEWVEDDIMIEDYKLN